MATTDQTTTDQEFHSGEPALVRRNTARDTHKLVLKQRNSCWITIFVFLVAIAACIVAIYYQYKLTDLLRDYSLEIESAIRWFYVGLFGLVVFDLIIVLEAEYGSIGKMGCCIKMCKFDPPEVRGTKVQVGRRTTMCIQGTFTAISCILLLTMTISMWGIAIFTALSIGAREACKHGPDLVLDFLDLLPEFLDIAIPYIEDSVEDVINEVTQRYEFLAIETTKVDVGSTWESAVNASVNAAVDQVNQGVDTVNEAISNATAPVTQLLNSANAEVQNYIDNLQKEIWVLNLLPVDNLQTEVNDTTNEITHFIEHIDLGFLFSLLPDAIEIPIRDLGQDVQNVINEAQEFVNNLPLNFLTNALPFDIVVRIDRNYLSDISEGVSAGRLRLDLVSIDYQDVISEARTLIREVDKYCEDIHDIRTIGIAWLSAWLVLIILQLQVTLNSRAMHARAKFAYYLEQHAYNQEKLGENGSGGEGVEMVPAQRGRLASADSDAMSKL